MGIFFLSAVKNWASQIQAQESASHVRCQNRLHLRRDFLAVPCFLVRVEAAPPFSDMSLVVWIPGTARGSQLEVSTWHPVDCRRCHEVWRKHASLLDASCKAL